MLTSRPRRSSRHVLAALALAVLGVAGGLGAGIAYAADQRLAEADLALQKAHALVQASQAGVVDAKAQKEFDKAVTLALADIASAREHILDAQNAVDNP